MRKNLLKLITLTLAATSLLTGCAIMPSRDQPLPAMETLPLPQAAEVTTPAEETAPATSTPVPPPASKPSIAPSGGPSIKKPMSYTVSDGELLWTIAKRADVYGDPLLWPLLYQANRDQIKDPRKIYAGQILTIPRSVNEEERENARIFAKKSDFFSPE